MSKSTLPAGVTEEMVKTWKEKFGADKIRIIAIPKDDNNKDFLEVVAKVPDRHTLGEFEKWADKNPNKAKEILITNCLLSHVEEVKASDELFLSATGALADLIPIRKAIIKNL